MIELVGISGSVSMENAGEDADIDLFIITRAGRMWTGRAVAAAAAAVMGLRRGRLTTAFKDKICLNMFMDSADLAVPRTKRSEFVAHEILQMKPVFARGAVYERFLEENKWIYEFFPNAKEMKAPSPYRGDASRTCLPAGRGGPIEGPRLSRGATIGRGERQDPNVWEAVYKKLQLLFINRHKTTEIVTDTQLWFFPDDYEKKVKV
jgi:hypothetical protein